LTIADFLLIAEAIRDIDAERLARVVDVNSAESALAARSPGPGTPTSTPTPPSWQRSSARASSGTSPLIDGNKRVAYIAMRELLVRNITSREGEATGPDATVWALDHVQQPNPRRVSSRRTPPGARR
jgi:hypothetical protein